MIRPQAPTQPWLVRALAAVPTALLAAFYLFVLRVRLSLGRWPLPYQPDPKSLDFEYHDTLVWILLIGFPFAGLLALFIAFYDHASARRNFPGKLLAGVRLSVAAVLAAMQLDPGEFFAWFFD